MLFWTICDNKLLADCVISFSSMVVFWKEESSPPRVVTMHLRLEDGRCVPLSLPADASLGAVRGAVGILLGCPSALLGLWYGGRRPADCTSLWAAGVLDGSTVDVTGRLLGGMPTGGEGGTEKEHKVCLVCLKLNMNNRIVVVSSGGRLNQSL